MPDINKIESSDPYRVDGRATVYGSPLVPGISVDIADGTTTNMESGIRVNPDASGTY